MADDDITRIAASMDEHRAENELFAYSGRFWSCFYSKSMRLFGDKKGGTFREMFDKAMRLIGPECQLLAEHPEDFYKEFFQPEQPETTGGFDVKRFNEYCDEMTRKRWGARHIPSRVVSEYLELIHPLPELLGGKPPMSRRDAVEEVARRFRFPSFNACYQYLKLQKAPLPPNWPKA